MSEELNGNKSEIKQIELIIEVISNIHETVYFFNFNFGFLIPAFGVGETGVGEEVADIGLFSMSMEAEWAMPPGAAPPIAESKIP